MRGPMQLKSQFICTVQCPPISCDWLPAELLTLFQQGPSLPCDKHAAQALLVAVVASTWGTRCMPRPFLAGFARPTSATACQVFAE